jgi:hypothetical protein
LAAAGKSSKQAKINLKATWRYGVSDSTWRWYFFRAGLMGFVACMLWVFERPPKAFAAVITLLSIGWLFGYITGHAEGKRDR